MPVVRQSLLMHHPHAAKLQLAMGEHVILRGASASADVVNDRLEALNRQFPDRWESEAALPRTGSNE
jgi:hypothetical protein